MHIDQTYLALEVVITSEEQTTRDGESDGGDTADGFGDL
jgi:hypothetical protein